MKQRPILMNGAMVRAVLDGSKTQTRRIMKPQPVAIPGEPGKHWWPSNAAQSMIRIEDSFQKYPGIFDDACPHGKPGDHLWVREAWYCDHFEVQRGPYLEIEDARALLVYAADGLHPYEEQNPWRPSIHMPRWASRILLEIVSVRVERLNDCSEVDAKAEGVLQLDADDSQRPEERTKECWAICPTCAGTGLRSTLGAGGGVNFDVDCPDCDTHLKLYRHLWEAINGAGSWAANPWVWAIEFKRVTP